MERDLLMKKRVPTEQEIAKEHSVDIKYVIRQAEIGSTIEREHVTDHQAAYNIALQHIAEFPDYYKHLLPMEDKLKKEWKKKKTVKQIKEAAKLSENHIAVAMGREIDDEGGMIMSQLDTIESAVKRLRMAVTDPKMQLPGWVQSKVTLACDYIDTAADYMTSKNEAVVYEEEKKEKEEKKFCKLCQKPEKKEECSYGPKAWERFSVPIPSVKQ
jgi:hypothetical protein